MCNQRHAGRNRRAGFWQVGCYAVRSDFLHWEYLPAAMAPDQDYDDFGVADKCGSENNDGFYMGADGKVKKHTNFAGGILGGMSDGDDIVLRAAFKPTPSIFQPQETVNRDGENVQIEIKGRHDPVIMPRAVVVVESMAAITIVDRLFVGMTARMDKICEFYKGE